MEENMMAIDKVKRDVWKAVGDERILGVTERYEEKKNLKQKQEGLKGDAYKGEGKIYGET